MAVTEHRHGLRCKMLAPGRISEDYAMREEVQERFDKRLWEDTQHRAAVSGRIQYLRNGQKRLPRSLLAEGRGFRVRLHNDLDGTFSGL